MKDMMTIKDRAKRLARCARESMRDCALSYRQAARRGQLARMTTQLCLAAEFRRIAAGYIEAA